MLAITKLANSLISITNGSQQNVPETQAEKKLLIIIKARWIIINFLLIYGLFSITLYLTRFPTSKVLGLTIWPFYLLAFAAIYNVFYHICWHTFPRLRAHKLLAQTQLIVDSILATLLVHFTGGALSWYWTLYILLIIESAYISENLWEILRTATITIFLYSLVIFGEYFQIIDKIKSPYLPSLNNELTYIIVVWFWVCFICLFSVYVSFFLREKEQLAVMDSLTNIYNRRFFDHLLKSEVNRAKRFGRTVSLLLIDIDNFKEYNDKFGHLEGDRILKSIAKILCRNLRRSEIEPTYDIDIACRFGGEEFAVILPETGKYCGTIDGENEASMCASIIAERLKNKIADYADVTVSIGLSTYPCHGNNTNSILLAADNALYKAKELGKNRIVTASLIETPNIVKVSNLKEGTKNRNSTKNIF